jgi:isopenicillin N synthase-like dioxygenase
VATWSGLFLTSHITPKRHHLLRHSARTENAGTLTLLFNRLGELQTLPPGKDAPWEYVRPLPGHAIVNLGDALATFTNGLLTSCPHRVVAPPGQQARLPRYSVVYFMRPENEVIMRRIECGKMVPELKGGASEGQGLTAEVWQYKKAMAVYARHDI